VEAIADVLQNRHEYWDSRPASERPTLDGVPILIGACAKKTGFSSAIFAAPPGPLGLATILPEILTNSVLQTKMIYDIAVAHEQDQELPPQLALWLLASGAGKIGTHFIVQAGGKLLVRRASLRAMQNLAGRFAVKVTQRALSKAIWRFLPGVGAAAMGIWTYHVTKRIGSQADELFARGIDCVDEEVEVDDVAAPAVIDMPASHQVEHCKLLINLMRVDKVVTKREEKLVARIASEQGLTERQVRGLLELDDDGETLGIDFDLLTEDPDGAHAIVLNMIALAKVDDRLHHAECEYIEAVMEKLGLPKDEQAELREVLEEPFDTQSGVPLAASRKQEDTMPARKTHIRKITTKIGKNTTSRKTVQVSGSTTKKPRSK